MPQADESKISPLNCKTGALLQVGQAASAKDRAFSTIAHDWPLALRPWPFVLKVRRR